MSESDTPSSSEPAVSDPTPDSSASELDSSSLSGQRGFGQASDALAERLARVDIDDEEELLKE